MHDLVALAEKREAACKEEISALLASRSTMYESRPSSSSQATKAAAAAAAAAAAEAESAGEAAGEEQELQQDEEDEEAVEAAAAKIEEAEKRMEAVQVGARSSGHPAAAERLVNSGAFQYRPLLMCGRLSAAICLGSNRRACCPYYTALWLRRCITDRQLRVNTVLGSCRASSTR